MYYKIINRKKRAFTIAADVIGRILWAPARLVRGRPVNRDEVKEILVARTAYIGDVVMTLPLLKPIRELFPKARVTFLTCRGAEGLFKNNPYVDSVIGYDAFWFYPKEKKGAYFGLLRKLRSRRFDLVIEARADIRDIFLVAYLSGARQRVSYDVAGGGFLLTGVVPFERVRHKVEYHLDIARWLGARPAGIDWSIRLASDEVQKARVLIGGNGADGPLIGMHPGGRKGLKCWPHERYAELADRLAEGFGAVVCFTGSAEESALIDGIIARMKNRGALNLAGKTDIRALASVISLYDLFITNDSAPLHIASAMKTPAVAIFGPSKSNETGPYGNVHRVVERYFPCRASCDEDVCLHAVHNECMTVITAAEVFTAAAEVLMESGKGKGAGYGVQA